MLGLMSLQVAHWCLCNSASDHLFLMIRLCVPFLLPLNEIRAKKMNKSSRCCPQKKEKKKSISTSAKGSQTKSTQSSRYPPRRLRVYDRTTDVSRLPCCFPARTRAFILASICCRSWHTRRRPRHVTAAYAHAPAGRRANSTQLGPF